MVAAVSDCVEVLGDVMARDWLKDYQALRQSVFEYMLDGTVRHTEVRLGGEPVEFDRPLEPDMTSTAVQVYDELFGWQWVTLIHRKDLSDLGEPYLSLVRKHREQWAPGRYSP